MAYDLADLVDKAPAIAREHASIGHRMKVSERVDTVLARHQGRLERMLQAWPAVFSTAASMRW